MSASPTPPALDAVLAEVGPPVLRYLRRYVGDAALAEDLRQETLLRIARFLPGFAGRSSLTTWALTIASRVAADYFRQPERQARIVPLDEAVELPELVDAEPLQGERIVADEMNQCVRQVIDSLPDSYRTALILHDLEGLSAAEVAQIGGCSLANAKIRIHRARQRLQAALQQSCAFYHDAAGSFRCDRKR